MQTIFGIIKLTIVTAKIIVEFLLYTYIYIWCSKIFVSTNRSAGKRREPVNKIERGEE